MKKIFLSIFAGIILSFFFGSSGVADPKPHYGGTLVLGTTNPPTMINPVFTSHSVSMSLLDLIFNRLVRIDPDGLFEPDLATRWEISPDGRQYTFFLRDDVFFHDGNPLTAVDVVFTYTAIMDPANNSPFRSHFALLDAVEALDARTVRFRLSKPFPAFLETVVRGIVPQHIFEDGQMAGAGFNAHPIGTGPFVFQSWDVNTDTITLVANKKYYEGRPFLDSIVVKTYPNNNQLWAALMRREADFVMFIEHDDYLIVKKDPTFKTYQINAEMYYALTYNPKDPIYFDREIRRAIAYGIDVDALMARVHIGGVKCNGPFLSPAVAENVDTPIFAYDPLAAKMMLMHRGWVDNDGDRIVEKGGRELELKMLVDARNKLLRRMAMEIRQQLFSVGIRVRVVLYDSVDQLTDEFLERVGPHAWLRMYAGSQVDNTDGYIVMGDWYSAATTFGRLWDYRNEKLDLLFEAARTTTDEKNRRDLYREAHRIVYADQPACFLFFPATFHAIAADFENTDHFFNHQMATYLMKNWYIRY